MFPSPAGVFFISSYNQGTLFNNYLNRFPSPAGVFFISSETGIKVYDIENEVSVPCRGLFYFIPIPDIPVYIRGYQLICGVKI